MSTQQKDSFDLHGSIIPKSEVLAFLQSHEPSDYPLPYIPIKNFYLFREDSRPVAPKQIIYSVTEATKHQAYDGIEGLLAMGFKVYAKKKTPTSERRFKDYIEIGLLRFEALDLVANETDDIDSIGEDRKDEHERERELRSRDDIPETEKSQLILARRGQGQFRTRVQLIERKCRVTGLSLLEHLTPSHIKPWKLSNRCEKLDGNNGLMLSPHADRLFDRGYISFKKKWFFAGVSPNKRY